MHTSLLPCALAQHSRARMIWPFGVLLALFVLWLPAPAQATTEIRHWVTDSGVRVYFVEARSIPMVDISIDFDAGSARDPDGLEGLSATTHALLTSGTTRMDEQQIAEHIADTGGQFSTRGSEDRVSILIRSLSDADPLNRLLALASDVISQPAYPANVIERERARALASLREALTKPDILVERGFNTAVFGDHPYGGLETEASISRITREELKDFHQRYFVRNNASVTIVGDVSRAHADLIARQLTDALPAGEPAPALPQPASITASVTRIAHPSEQAHLRMGQPGMQRDDPDYYPLLVGNYVLGGGGFVSRLTREVRDARGLAYSVYSYFFPQAVRGIFQIGLQTRSDQADEALTVVNDTVRDFIANGPTPEELAAAKSNIINGFGLKLDANSKMLGYVSMIGFYGLPLDWLAQYTRRVEAVTADQVRDAFRRRVPLSSMATVIAGAMPSASASDALPQSGQKVP